MKKSVILLGTLISFFYIATLMPSCSTCSDSCFVNTNDSRPTYCHSSCLEEQTHIYKRCGLCDWQSQSFFFPRPVYDNVAAKQALWHNIIFEKEKSQHGALQFLALVQDSLSDEKIKRYFLFNRKTSLTVKGDDYKGTRDIRAEWLGITDPNFNGVLTIDPKQRQYALMATYQQDVKKFIKHDYFNKIWVQIDAPLVISETDMRLGQSFVNTTTGMDICQAFNQCDWKFAKIRGKEKRVAIPELIVSLGTSMLNKNHNQIGLSSGLIIPTIDKYDPSYLLTPVLGHNKHWGFTTAIQFQICLNDSFSPDKYLALFINMENQFFFRNYQYRTYDLIGKPWSRYLQFNCKDGRRNIPGVNVLTLETRVDAYNMFDLSAGFRIYGDGFEAEAGYNMWAHGSEQLRLRRPFPAIYGIAGKGTAETNCPSIVTDDIGATASKSTIHEQCDDDTTFTPITVLDIDLDSAASRTTITHKFHVAMGCTFKDSGFAGIGFWFEGPHNNAMYKQWGAWAKIGTTV